MAVDMRSHGQMTLFENTLWRTVVVLEVNHRLITLCQSIAWEGLMEQAIPILYDEQGISREALSESPGAFGSVYLANDLWLDRQVDTRALVN